MNRFTRLLMIVALVALAPAGSAVAAQDYTIDSAHSSVGFTIRHILSRTPGKFNQFSGSIPYDA